MNKRSINFLKEVWREYRTAGIYVGTGITMMNLLNIPDPKNDMITLRLAGLSVVKGFVYGVTVAEFGPFAIVGMFLHTPREYHFIPCSQYCTDFRKEALTKNDKE